MERNRAKPILIPTTSLKRLQEAVRDALERSCRLAGLSTGKEVDILAKVTQMRFEGIRKPDDALAAQAVADMNNLLAIIEYMAEKSGDFKDDDLKTAFLSDFQTLVQLQMDILIWFETGDEYHIPDDVQKLLIEVGIARMKRSYNVDPDKLIGELLYKNDPIKIAQLSNGMYPVKIVKFIIEKKIRITDAVKAINREFGARHKLIENEMDALRAAKIEGDQSWEPLWKKKDQLIDKWKTALTTIS